MIKLAFDAPLMSFGGPAVDQVGNTFQFPPKSMLTGLLGAALGYGRSEHQKLQQVQAGFTYGVREDRPGEVIEDFQTVDLQAPWMTGMWKDGTYQTGDDVRETDKRREILNKQYIADAVYTVVLAPTDLPEDAFLGALRRPNWPLYIGRKSCGAGPLRPERVEYETVRGALEDIDLHPDAKMKRQYRIWTEGGDRRSIYGLRDWESRIHAGKQWIEEETIEKTTS
jgi:CRISPR system Cascade subunit CasD